MDSIFDGGNVVNIEHIHVDNCTSMNNANNNIYNNGFENKGATCKTDFGSEINRDNRRNFLENRTEYTYYSQSINSTTNNQETSNSCQKDEFIETHENDNHTQLSDPSAVPCSSMMLPSTPEKSFFPSSSPFFIQPRFLHRKTADFVRRAKKHHRKDIASNEWGKWNYVKSDICERSLHIEQNIPRIKKETTMIEDFVENFERPRFPCILQGYMEGWGAMENWTVKKLNSKYKNARFKVGEKDNGDKIKMKMKYFLDYMENQTDDSPLYLFESCVGDRTENADLLKDWKTPDVFPLDLYTLTGEERRPPFRWFCIGPKRSGTTVHVDPLGTDAWNALAVGEKRWVLFPPDTPKWLVKGKHLLLPDEDDEAIMWFDNILPRIKAKYPNVRIIECIQYPGEIIYVPGGWHHAVLNCSDTIACTQNYGSYVHIQDVWRCLRRGRPKLAVIFYKEYEKCKSLLKNFEYIEYVNMMDGYRLESNRFVKLKKQQNIGSDISSSSSSNSSSSSSESSSDEEDDWRIYQEIKSMADKISTSLWKVYLKDITPILLGAKLNPSYFSKQSPSFASKGRIYIDRHDILEMGTSTTTISGEMTPQHITADEKISSSSDKKRREDNKFDANPCAPFEFQRKNSDSEHRIYTNANLYFSESARDKRKSMSCDNVDVSV